MPMSVEVIFDSGVSDVFASKCCGARLPDHNIEILVRNGGASSVTLLPGFTLENRGKKLRCDSVYPPWNVTVPPGDSASRYCRMDAEVFNRYESLVLYEAPNRKHRFRLSRTPEP